MTTYKPIQKTGIVYTFVLFFLSAASLFAEIPIWAPEPLDKIIHQGLSHNNEIKSLEALIKSIEAESDFASSLSDPKIGISLLNMPVDSFRLDKEPMTQKQFFVSQKIPWHGKLDLKSKGFMLKAKYMKALLQAKRLEISSKIAKQFYNLCLIRYNLLINTQLHEMVKQALSIAETLYASGQGLQQDIFQGQVEISKLQEEKIHLMKSKQVSKSRILSLINQQTSVLLNQIKGTIVFSNLQVNAKKLHKLALENNPFLKAKEAEIDAAKINVDLAKKDFYPDFDIKIAYSQRDEDRNGNNWSDFFSASIAMNISLWKKNRQDKKLISTLAAKKSLEKAHKNLRSTLPHRIDELLAEIESSEKSYALYSDNIISKTEEWALSAQAAYEVGKIEFNSMIKAQLRVLNFKQQAKKYLFDTLKKRADLEELLGIPVPVTKKRYLEVKTHG